MSSILTSFVAITSLISNSYKALYFNVLQENQGKLVLITAPATIYPSGLPHGVS